MRRRLRKKTTKFDIQYGDTVTMEEMDRAGAWQWEFIISPQHRKLWRAFANNIDKACRGQKILT